MTDQSSADLNGLTTDIVVAYLANNEVVRADIPVLIASVHAALGRLGQPDPAPERPEPAVSIKKSLTPDYLISLEDGRRYKSLKRHLSGRGMTPAEYRAKWGLPNTYPMVAPSYAKQRSELSKALGLGRKAAPAPAEVKATARGKVKRSSRR